MMIDERPLLMHIQHFLRESAMARTRFGREAVGDPRLVDDLARGRTPSERTRDRVMGYIETRRAEGVASPPERPRRAPVRRAPAPISELTRRASLPRPAPSLLPPPPPTTRRSCAPRLIAELLRLGRGVVELIDATERDWFSATFEGARHRIRLSLPASAPLPPALVELRPAALELRRALVAEVTVEQPTPPPGAPTRELIVEVLTLDFGDGEGA